MAITATGLSSGLDVNGLIDQLMQVERQPLAALQSRESAYQAQRSALDKVKSALAATRAALVPLATRSALSALTAVSSDSAVLGASAGTSAAAGVYDVEVSKLAQRHSLHTQAFADTDEALGTGTLTIEFGTWSAGVYTPDPAKAALAIDVPAGGDSLTGVRDAINAANAGVRASIVNDGSGYRLVLTATDGGAANSLRITVADDDGVDTDTSGLSRLAFDPAAAAGAGRNLTEAVAAQNAVVSVNGITLTSGSNTISGAIDGLTLTLAKVGTTTVTVGRDEAGILSAVDAFVKSYNSLNSTLRDLTAYDPATKKAGTLLGDATVRSLQSTARSILGGSVAGLGGSVTALSHIGVGFGSDGSLAVDRSRLQAALGESWENVAAVLAPSGSTSDGLIAWAGASTATRAGTYDVTVTQLAARGSLAGSAAAGLTVTAGVNDTFEFTVDGVAATVTIAAGTYASAGALAAEIQAKVNAAPALVEAGASVAVGASGGVLTATSRNYGSGSEVRLTGGNGATGAFGAAPVESAGRDAAGTINGVAAVGAGQTLVGAAGDASDGLRLTVVGGALGARGSVTYSVGAAAQLDRFVASVLDAEGTIASRIDGIDASIKRLTASEDAFQRRLDDIEKRYRTQFVALDAMLSRMNTTSSFLQNQLASLL